MSHLAILALLQALQKEVTILENELAQQTAVSAPVPASFNQSSFSTATLGNSDPIVNEVPASGDQAPTSTASGSSIVYVPLPVTIPATLASSSYCQGNVDPGIAGLCQSTSTAMCSYQEPPQKGGGVIPMYCVAIQLCTFEKNCQ